MTESDMESVISASSGINFYKPQMMRPPSGKKLPKITKKSGAVAVPHPGSNKPMKLAEESKV